jgi:hypothetical protein
MFKALSAEFHGRLAFGELKSSEMLMMETINTNTFPSVVVIPKGAEPSAAVKYTGKFTLFFFRGFSSQI